MELSLFQTATLRVYSDAVEVDSIWKRGEGRGGNSHDYAYKGDIWAKEVTNSFAPNNMP